MKHLEYKKGFKYTQSKEVDLMDIIIANEVYLAVNDNESNWKLITDQEADEILKLQMEKAEEM